MENKLPLKKINHLHVLHEQLQTAVGLIPFTSSMQTFEEGLKSSIALIILRFLTHVPEARHDPPVGISVHQLPGT